jgi:HD superfamily phosphohydrolase
MKRSSAVHDPDPARSLTLDDQGEQTMLRDRLYDQIPLGPGIQRLISTPSFVRLEGMRQLGFVARQWPGATHTRFEHSLGCSFLAQQALRHLLRSFTMAIMMFSSQKGSCVLVCCKSLD